MIKTELITSFLTIQLGMEGIRLKDTLNRIDEICRLQPIKKNQEFEVPGPSEEGRIWFSVEAMAHSFYHCQTNNDDYGYRIYEKLAPIFFAGSLIDHDNREYFIRLLEPGLVLSIAYSDALELRKDIKEIREYIDLQIRKEILASQQHIKLLNERSPHRVKGFEVKNKLFCTITSIEIRAMHLGMSRQGYYDQLNK